MRARILVAALAAIAAVACVDRITYVDRPVPTPGPLRVDTVVQQHPETTIVQLPGRVDTVVTRTPPETTLVQLPPRVDTVITQRLDTVIVTVHDTVIKHDTVIHVDTVLLHRIPASICMYLTSGNGDTIYLERKTALNACAPQPMAQAYIDRTHRADGDTLFVVLFDSLIMQLPAARSSTSRSATRVPSPLISPASWAHFTR